MGSEFCQWKTVLLWATFISCVCLLFLVDIFQPHEIKYMEMQQVRFQQTANPLQGFLVKTKGCRIPYMNPFDVSIKKFISLEDPPICNKGIPALMGANETAIYLIPSSLPFYQINLTDTVSCCYTPFWRVNPKKNEKDGKIKYGNKCLPFNGSANITDEFIKVTCRMDQVIIYKDFFSFVPIKRRTGNKADKPMNILIIGLDSVSRLNFYRQMPQTLNFLKNISAVEMYGYNKVGDNTFPNLIPVLTGLSETELQRSCWSSKKYFDGCPFIWKDFNEKGYVTSFGEDAGWMGIFNYDKRGFRQQPTDYLWTTWNRVAEKEIGNSHNMNVYECVGAEEVYMSFLNYIEKFVSVMERATLPYFAFFWEASLTHDYLNKAKLGDDSYHAFLRKLNSSGYLDNTVLVVMSDHGIRWGSIRQTYQGKLEERLPFLFVVLPNRFKKTSEAAYVNLLKNSRQLTTPFDVHETLKDLLNVKQIDTLSMNNGRGVSLFRRISSNRNCDSAGISSHWCTCQQSSKMNIDNRIVRECAKFTIKYINLQLEGYKQCAQLGVRQILNASELKTISSHTKGTTAPFTDYMITFVATPGDGVFEATVRISNQHKIQTTYHFELIGTISRLNLYGKQSLCITDFHLKLYCYCYK